jgi:hypothetical protein
MKKPKTIMMRAATIMIAVMKNVRKSRDPARAESKKAHRSWMIQTMMKWSSMRTTVTIGGWRQNLREEQDHIKVRRHVEWRIPDTT